MYCSISTSRPPQKPRCPQFDAQCLEFVLEFFASAKDAFYGPPDGSGPRRDLSLTSPIAQSNMQNPLFLKQAIIVLREELEYFAIPPTSSSSATTPTSPPRLVGGDKDANVPGTDEHGKPNEALLRLKVDCGRALLERKSIFTALQRNVNRENNVAEQHLIDMLCMSGFERDDVWGYRSVEPNRCCIASIALVLLKTGIVHPPLSPLSTTTTKTTTTGALDEYAGGDGGEADVQVNAQQLATAQKLLLFWRKPAVSSLVLRANELSDCLSLSLCLFYGGTTAQVLVGRDGFDDQRRYRARTRRQSVGSPRVDA